MRLDFLKEVQFLKGIINPNQLPDVFIENYLKVNLFNEMEGVDPELVKLLNHKLKFLLKQYN